MKRRNASKTMELGAERCANCASIDAKLDLGEGLSVVEYEKVNEKTRKSLAVYNTSIATTESLLEAHETNEMELADFNERMLIGVAYKYGKNSNEYKMAGGTKKSERKKPSKPNDKEIK